MNCTPIRDLKVIQEIKLVFQILCTIRGIQLLRSHLKGEGGSIKIQTHASQGKRAHDNPRIQKWTGIVVKSRKRFTIFLFLLFY